MSIRSFILLKHLSRVDLPQPEGPIKAVTLRRGKFKLMLCRALTLP